MLLFIRVTNNTEEIELLEKPNLIISLKKKIISIIYFLTKFCEESAHVTKTQNAL
jgi:hypothetical protein